MLFSDVPLSVQMPAFPLPCRCGGVWCHGAHKSEVRQLGA